MDNSSKITNKLIVPCNTEGEDFGAEKELLENLTDEKIEAAGEEYERIMEENNKKKEMLVGDTNAILEDLKENHVKIEEDKEMMGYKGKIVHIDLPAVGNFGGYKFDYFVSDGSIKKRDFELNSNLVDKSYSMKDVSELLQGMNEYMKELKGKNDGYMNYEDKLRRRKYYEKTCNAGECLKHITGLDYWYWLKDKNVAGINNSCVRWGCSDVACTFCRCILADDYANLLLRLSD